MNLAYISISDSPAELLYRHIYFLLGKLAKYQSI